MVKYVLVVLFALVLGADTALAQPREDDDRLTVTLTTDTPQYIGPCPAAVEFTGTIVGPPGTVVQYQFTQRYGIQPPPYIASVLATIPASGKLLVRDTIGIDAAHAGGHSEELRVSPAALTATAALFASCVVATP